MLFISTTNTILIKEKNDLLNEIRLISDLNKGQIQDQDLQLLMKELNLNDLEDILLYLLNKVIIEVPCPCLKTTPIVYDGIEKTIPLIDENGEIYLFDDLVEVSGTTKATNAGKYFVTISLKNPYNSIWKDYENAEIADDIAVSTIPENKKDSITVEWEIKKADILTTVDKTNIVFDLDNLTETVTFLNMNWDIGEYAEFIGAGDEDICSIETPYEPDISKPTFSFIFNSLYKEGTATLFIKWTDLENYNNKEIIINIKASNMPDPILNNNTPEMIQKTAQAGIAPNIWNVGDIVGISLNGTVGDLNLDNTYYAFILGFNHNPEIEGNNTIHFQFGKDIAFIDSKYYTAGNNTGFRMNFTNTNAGGWKDSYMRKTICEEFKSVIDSNWRDIISQCKKYTDNIGDGSNSAVNVDLIFDYIFLLSEFEVFGIRKYSNSVEQNFQKQYDYYKNGNSSIKYKYNDLSSKCLWWLRSPLSTNTVSFCIVGINEDSNTQQSHMSQGFAPAFMIA